MRFVSVNIININILSKQNKKKKKQQVRLDIWNRGANNMICHIYKYIYICIYMYMYYMNVWSIFKLFNFYEKKTKFFAMGC